MTDNKVTPAPHTPNVPVSWGELIDKITILEIKNERIKAPVALANVVRELALLRQKITPEVAAHAQVWEFTITLKAINESLWEVEDHLRDKEKAKTFDQDFITLARSVYRLNDQRAAVKKQINVALASEIVEEKSYGR